MVLKTKGAVHQVQENQGELPAPNLKQLIIIECNNLKSLPERIHTFTALRELRIDGLPNLVSFAERGLPPNLRHFSIQNCERLRALVREHWGLQQLVSLEEFYIGGRASDDILEMLLKEQLLLPLFTLQNYKSEIFGQKGTSDTSLLFNAYKLEAVQVLNFCNFNTSLLYIRECDLPKEGLPPSLSSLRIVMCSALAKRYENKTGQDWDNISHIRCPGETKYYFSIFHYQLSTLRPNSG